MGSINQNENENEKYTLHFIFHTNILHIKFSWIHVIKNIKIAYIKLWGDNRSHKTSYMRIHQVEYIQVYIDYLIEYI